MPSNEVQIVVDADAGNDGHREHRRHRVCHRGHRGKDGKTQQETVREDRI